jgi:predicted nucleic acid-binding protein
MTGVDTNILLYAKDPRDLRKQQIAASLIPTLTDGVLFWQVAVEYLAASRKLEAFGYSRKMAFADLGGFQNLWQPILPSWSIFNRAEYLLDNYKISYFDALIVAACLENSIPKLYTEDIADNFRKEGLEIINPF